MKYEQYILYFRGILDSTRPNCGRKRRKRIKYNKVQNIMEYL